MLLLIERDTVCVEFEVICARFTSAALFPVLVDSDAYIPPSSLPRRIDSRVGACLSEVGFLLMEVGFGF